MPKCTVSFCTRSEQRQAVFIYSAAAVNTPPPERLRRLLHVQPVTDALKTRDEKSLQLDDDRTPLVCEDRVRQINTHDYLSS